MSVMEERVWAGSEGSYDAALTAEQGLAERTASGQFDDDEDDEDSPRLLSVEDGVATIAIHGPLVNSDSPWLEYFGVTGYGEIRSAMLAAAYDPEVTHILLDIDSGGGAVSGVDDTAKLIRMVNDRVKPVTTFTDGAMASAAYWLGSAAGDVYSSKAALVGSIGVIACHKEYSEAYKKEGVGVTVVRAGKHKALANSNEKLTEEGKAQIQKIVDASYGIFVEHVAAMRGKSYEYTDKTMADGQEFIGQAGVDVGLTDAITTFDALMSTLKQKSLEYKQKLMDNRGVGKPGFTGASSESSTVISGDADMAKKALTEADIAVLAAGGTLGAVAVEATSETAPAATTAPEVQPEASAKVSAEVSSEGAKDETAQVASTPEVAKPDAAVQLLTAQLKDKDAALLEASVKLSKLEDRVAQFEASVAPLVEIAAKSISNMQIALGGSAYVASASADAVVADHVRVSEQFKSKFKVGGVAAVSADTPNETFEANSAEKARLNAVRFSR